VRFGNWKSGRCENGARHLARCSSRRRAGRCSARRCRCSNEFPPKDVVEMSASKHNVFSTLIDNAAVRPDEPVAFDNVKVRRAIAHAIPYQKILDVALYNKARPLFGGSAEIKDARGRSRRLPILRRRGAARRPAWRMVRTPFPYPAAPAF
jgi:peptide/nickel transport system substrate-binding protein